MWPGAAPGQIDNVVAQGQTITAPSAASGGTLAFLGAADNAPAAGTSGTGKITYTDGSTQNFTLAWSDWTLNGGTSTPITADAIVASTTYRNTGGGAQVIPTYVFYTSVGLTAGKTVASITLPSSTNNAGRLHVFAISIGGGPGATSTSTTIPLGTATKTPTPTLTPVATPTSPTTGGTFNLTAQFNNVGISSDSSPGSGDFDGAGYSTYSANALSAAGLTAGQNVTSNGVTFVWPNAAPGQVDNVVAQGQTITAPSAASGGTLAFLGSADNAPAAGTSGTGKITYTDGSTQNFTLAWSDWTLNGGTGTPITADAIVASTTYRNTGGGAQAIPTYVFYTFAPISSGKTVASITLPSSTVGGGQLHVFAISISGTSSAASSMSMPIPVDTPQATPTIMPSATPTRNATATLTSIPTMAATGTPTKTPTITPTSTPTGTSSGTPAKTQTSTPTGIPTGIPSIAPTNTLTSTPTDTLLPT